MTEPIRRDLLQVLERLSEQAPQVRFGQLVANLSYLARGPENESVWEVEDDELLTAAERHLETLKNRTSSPDRAAG